MASFTYEYKSVYVHAYVRIYMLVDVAAIAIANYST